MSGDVERVKWETFRQSWHPTSEQGTHVTIIGPTGSGKTTLLIGLLPGWPWTLEIVSKRSGGDFTASEAIRKSGAKVIERWPPKSAFDRRIVLWPRFRTPADVPSQCAEIRRALVAGFTEGQWCVVVDDAQYAVNTAQAGAILELYWFHSRSSGAAVRGNSLVTVWPRPAWVPLLAYSAATWLFVAGTSDKRDAQRLSEISGAGRVDVARMVEMVQRLPRYSFLAVDTREGTICVVDTKDAITP